MEKDKLYILEEYKKGRSILSISESLPHLSYYRVHKTIKDAGIEVRDNGHYATQYQYDESVFDINNMTEDDCYWLGFLLADGSVNKKDKQIKIDLTVKDIDHLKKLQKHIGTDKPIKVYTNNIQKDYARLVISNNVLFSKLYNMGVVERKTEIVKYPTFIPQQYQKDFIRGYVDADGSIKKGSLKENTQMYMLSIIGTEDMLDGIINNIPVNENFCSTRRKRKPTNPNKGIEIGGRLQLKNVITFLYKDAKTSLKRKQERADYIMRRY